MRERAAQEWMINMNELEKNLMDMLVEQQLKLGFRKEQVTFYYPKTFLEHLLGVEPGEEIAGKLSEFSKEVEKKLGKIEISHVGERFRIVVPEEGSSYVREHMGNQAFLKTFLEEISKPACTPEKLKRLFEQFAGNGEIVAQKLQDEEFDCLYYFKDGKPDRYRYCVTFEEHHATYHRFLPEDYADFGFKEGKTF